MPRTKNIDEVQTNSDLPEQPISTEEQTIRNQAEEIDDLRSMQQLLMQQMSRLEGVQNKNKLRKWDEQNDSEALKKTGRVPSFDGKDPIVSIVRSGNVVMDDNGFVADRQFLTLKTLSGVEKKLVTMEFIAECTGNSIACQVNDWDVLLEKLKKLNAKKSVFQRSNGKSMRVNTVELWKEIKAEEKSLTVNVTLSEDMGKSFTGMTLDVPWQDVFNAIG